MNSLPTLQTVSKATFVLAGSIVSLLAAEAAPAALLYWDAAPSTSVWTTAANWSTTSGADTPNPGAAPINGDTAIFNVASSQSTINLGTSLTMSSINFDGAAGAFTLGSGAVDSQTLIIGGGGLFQMLSPVANNQTIAAKIQLGGNAGGATYSFSNASTTNSLIVTGSITQTGSGTAGTKILSISGAGNMELNGAITKGTALGVTLMKTGNGTLTLGSASTVLTTLSMGGGQLNLAGKTITGGVVTITTAAASGNTISNGSLTGTSFAASNATGTAVISANLLGSGGFTKSGAGTVELTGANTFTGPTQITAGSIVLKNNLALQSSAFDTSGAGTLNLSDAAVTAPTLGGVTGDASTGQDFALPANVTALTLNVASGTATYAKNLSAGAASLTLTKSGAGTQILSGTNTYTGTTAISAGELRVTSGTALGGNSVTVTGTGQLALDGGITIGSSKTLTTSGAPANFLGGLQSVSGTNEWAGNVVLSADLARMGPRVGATLVLSGVIDDGANTFGLIVRNETVPANFGGGNANTVTILSGASTYGGVTQLISGLTKLDGGDNRLPVGTVLQFGASSTTAKFDLNGRNQEVAGLAVLSNASGGRDWNSNELTNSSATLSTLTVNTAVDRTFGTVVASANITGVITGNVALVKSGAATLTLSGTNTYSGTTTINGGTLLVSGSIAGSATTVADHGTLRGAGSVGNVSVSSGGTINAGNTLDAAGTMNVGNATGTGFALGSGGHLTLELGGIGAGQSDRINVTNGSGISLAGDLTGSLINGYQGQAFSGDLIFIIVNNGDGAISGSFSNQFTFNGLNTVTIGGTDFHVSYDALFVADGDAGNAFHGGNDVALLAIPEPGAAVSLLGGLGLLLGLRRRRA